MSGPEGRLVLAGDVGGTKTFLGLYEARGDSLAPLREARLLNNGFKRFEDLLDAFLEAGAPCGPESACLGVAGPVEAGRCVMTNIRWTVDEAALRRRLGAGRVEITNDMVAAAWGIALLAPDDILVLQEGSPAEGNAALMAAGTGLGEAVLFWDGSTHAPYATEGGHADFAPRSPVEADLLIRLAGLYGHVSYERVLSGPGLENIYRFLRKRSGAEEPQYLSQRLAESGATEAVTEEAVNGKDPVCAEALRVFASIYGAEAGNLALKTMARAGVYLAGGMAPRVLKAAKDAFLASFRDKGRLEGLLSGIPVYVILNEKAGLFGAARHAAGMLPGAGARGAISRIERP